MVLGPGGEGSPELRCGPGTRLGKEGIGSGMVPHPGGVKGALARAWSRVQARERGPGPGFGEGSWDRTWSQVQAGKGGA